jgi:peptidoglycan/LPS O-acetylase OafA/YrhL
MQQGYLPHLDGLRAIAVGLVVLFHAGYTTLSGGFIGVDVFFVLSGFLITGQLAKNLDKGQFSFSQFYLRRVRRLAPAYLAVALASLVAALFIMLPEDLIYHARLTVLALVSLSNFYLSNTTGGYFESDTDEIALLHTWSLSVEEQYYLLWPAMLLLLWKLQSPRLRLGLIGALLVVSVLFSGWYTSADPSRAYYLLPARFHELLIGALLALVGHRLPTPSRPLRELLCWGGLALIIQAGFTLAADQGFPGYQALAPCLGTALLIYAGNEPSSVHYLLTRRVMVWLGMLSYSLYLWHWPVFSFARYATGELTPWMGAAGIALAIALSHLTWRFVEQPFRFRWLFTPRKTFAVLFFGPALALTVVAGVLDAGDGFMGRFGKEAEQAIRAMESTPGKHRIACPDDTDKPCADILLAGDSHAEHFGDFLSVIAADAGLTLNTVQRPGCPALPGLTPTYLKDGALKPDPKCVKHNARLYRQLHRYDYVVLAGYWALADMKADRYFFTSEHWPELDAPSTQASLAAAFREGIQRIVDAGAIPVIIQDNPTAPDQLFQCSRRKLLPFYDEPCTFSDNVLTQQQGTRRALFAELADAFPSLQFIDPNALICADGTCTTELDGLPIYRDDDHLNRMGSEYLGQRYLEVFGNPFSPARTPESRQQTTDNSGLAP